MTDRPTSYSRLQPVLTALTIAAAVLAGQVVGRATENGFVGAAAGLAVGLIGFATSAVLAARAADR